MYRYSLNVLVLIGAMNSTAMEFVTPTLRAGTGCDIKQYIFNNGNSKTIIGFLKEYNGEIKWGACKEFNEILDADAVNTHLQALIHAAEENNVAGNLDSIKPSSANHKKSTRYSRYIYLKKNTEDDSKHMSRGYFIFSKKPSERTTKQASSYMGNWPAAQRFLDKCTIEEGNTYNELNTMNEKSVE